MTPPAALAARLRRRRRPGAGPARPGERGVALLLALLTMVLLSVIVIEFTVSTQVQYRRAAMWLAARRAALVAEGGLLLAGEVLRQDSLLGNTDALSDLWARELPPIDTGAGLLSIRIEDEQGKLNLNDLASGALSPAGRRFQALLDGLDLDPGLASAVADWVDRNRDPGPGALAAEDDWYGRLERPYEPRNSPLASYAELALVRGFSPTVLRRLRPYVTVLPESGSRVNANTAAPAVLRAMDPRLDDAGLVRRIVEARTSEPLARIDDLRAVGGVESLSAGELERMFTFSSRWFRVRSTGDVNGALRSAEALLDRNGGSAKVVYLLQRRGPNIVGLDPGVRASLDDVGFPGAPRR